MDCLQVQDRLSAYLDGELPAELRRQVEEHLEACPACREELAWLGRLDKTFDRLAAPSPDVTSRVMERLRRPPLTWWRSLALAASLVLGLVLGGALAGNFYPYAAGPSLTNGDEVLAMEEAFRDFPQGSWGNLLVYPDEEDNSA